MRRRLLSLIAILLVATLGLGGATPALADGHEDDEEGRDPAPSPTPTSDPNNTSAPPPDNRTGTSPNNTSAPPPDERPSSGRDGADYERTRARYLEAWDRLNESQREEEQARLAFEASRDACRRSEGTDREACQDMQDDAEEWEDARARLERAQREYSEARAAYEQARAERGERNEPHATPCGPGERRTEKGPCVREQRPSPSPSARQERQEAYERWQRERETREVEHRQRLERVPEEQRRDLGLCRTSGDLVACRHVHFRVDTAHDAILNVTVSEATVFERITFPGPPHAGGGGHSADLVRLEGDEWRFLLSDGPAAPMRFRGDAEHPFFLTVPAGTVIEDAPGGYRLRVPSDGATLEAHVGGDIARDAHDATTLVVHGDARFVVHGRSTAMGRLAEDSRHEMQQAIERGHLGAEVSVLRGESGQGRPAPVLAETILYEDMNITLEEGAVRDPVPTERRVYTVTVDAETHEGRTVALSFQEGLLDPETLAFRHFAVAGDGTTSEVAIIKATSLEDVLDPADDGTVSEWWLVADESGLQVLVSFPGFSVHKIELASLDAVLKDPSLLLGLLGATAVVTLGLIALFRRPEDP